MGDPRVLIDGGSRGSGGAGGGGTVVAGEVSGTVDSGGRIVDAGVTGCENGFPGPRGASAKLCPTAEFGAEFGAYEREEEVISALFNASDIDGSEVLPLGDSLSSLVDRLELDSGGDMYPDTLCPGFPVETAEEYGGGGPE